MIDDLLRALIASKNEAADDVLVDALRIGTPGEQLVVLGAILARKNSRSMAGVIELFDRLPEPTQQQVLSNAGSFHTAIREAGRGENTAQRLAAIRFIATARQGKLAYVLSENLHAGNEAFAKSAANALAEMARWIARSIQALQTGAISETTNASAEPGQPTIASLLYAQIIENRPEIEAAIVRALELHRGALQQELLHAALLLCDHSQASAMRVLGTSRHGGQGVMIRRIQQTPEADHVPAFLLGATHGNLRSHFGVAFSKIDTPVVLDAILRKSHWLPDAQLQLCTRQIHQGAWWGDTDLNAELARRGSGDAALIAQWIGASGATDQFQDQKLGRVLDACGDNFTARLRVFRVAASSPQGTSVELLKRFLRDPDERIARMSVREIIRRRPPEFGNLLLPLMTDAPDSVRRVVSRAIGQQGFETFWQRYDHLDKSARKAAGKAMLKLLPDATARLARRMSNGTIEQRVKALGMARDLGLVELMKASVLPLCAHPNPRVRSKAVTVLSAIGAQAVDVLIEKVVNDTDPRVRANAIEVMEARGSVKFVPLLAERAHQGANRERANAIKALHSMKVGTAAGQLLQMLRDDRAEHRISAMWALRKVGWWRMLAEIARLAREDENLRVRQYAMNVLQSAAGEATVKRKAAG
jgi:HEAT repeat protein